MKHHFLPQFAAISMTKSQFCFSTGLTPYKLRCILSENPSKWAKLGYHRWDKLLMPAVVEELLAVTGLRINLDYFTQYVAGQRGISSQVVTE